MLIDTFQLNETRKRYMERTPQRARNLRLISEGRVLAVDKPDRVVKFLRHHDFTEPQIATLLGRPTTLPSEEPLDERIGHAALERVMGTNDLMGVAFLERGLQAARTVARVLIGGAAGQPMGYGTGFMISPSLLITNHHVLGNAMIAGSSLVEFEYQLGIDGRAVGTTVFTLEPARFFLADRALDYAVVAVHPVSQSGRAVAEFGWNRLIGTEGKAIAAQWLNIIQHPNGEPKQLCLRENRLVDVLDDYLHYQTDTDAGSSGSPAFNDRWEVVALHHSGVWATNAAGQTLAVDGQVWRPEMGEHRIKWIANEGVRASRLVAHLQGRGGALKPEGTRLLEEALDQSPQPAVPVVGERGGPPAPSGAPEVQVAADGTVTWTIPLSVSVRLGGAAPTVAGMPVQRPAEAPAAAVPPPALPPVVFPTPLPAMPIGDGTQEALAAARTAWTRRSDVLAVRLGYVFRDGWITRERALVVSVPRKRTAYELSAARIAPLPETFHGLPVEVTGPTMEDLVAMARGPAVAEAAFRDEGTLAQEILYTPPAGVTLEPVTGKMRVIAHVSPDAGWPQLSAFLTGVRKRLVVGMYDFGAPHVLDALERAVSEGRLTEMKLVMQSGESVGTGTKADDLHDRQVVERLAALLDERFENAWVRLGSVNGWVASSYHIKLAVRDGAAFWLSSGNWQSSNLPPADPLGGSAPDRSWLDRYNRDWHAIVEHPGLAKRLEAFLLNDLAANRGPAPQEVLALPDLLVPVTAVPRRAAERAMPFRYFTPFDENRSFTVQPLLTPDNYHEHVLRLIEGAGEELLIQNQTFNAPRANHQRLRELMDAVLERKRAGVKLRVIFRVLMPADARRNLEALLDFGFDPADIKVQEHCHTKAIIADRKRLLLGSQNWSNDGVSVNRDASLLFDDAPLARYFAEIFDHDWDVLAQADIGQESAPVVPVDARTSTPPGYVRLSAKDYLELA